VTGLLLGIAVLVKKRNKISDRIAFLLAQSRKTSISRIGKSESKPINQAPATGNYDHPAEKQEKAMCCNRRAIRKFKNLPKWQPDSD